MRLVYAVREIEISNARAHHLYLSDPDTVNLLLPVTKTESQGNLTLRSYVCVCRARQEPLCPFHCARRHLERLRLAGVENSAENYLFPGHDGQPMKKFQVVQLIERVLQAASVETTRADEAGRQVPRFGGHVLRVSGTQYLAAFERASGADSVARTLVFQVDRPRRAARSTTMPHPITGITMDQIRAEIAKAIPPVQENLIAQPRRRVAHAIGVPRRTTRYTAGAPCAAGVMVGAAIIAPRRTAWAQS